MKTKIKQVFNQFVATFIAAAASAELTELKSENARLRAQVEQCQMALAVWATDAESFRLDAEMWKERAEKWQEIATQLSPMQQIGSCTPWGKN